MHRHSFVAALTSTRYLSFLATLATVLIPTSNLAWSQVNGEDPAAAKAHYAAGLQHFNLAEYEQALVEFKEGYRSKSDPVFLFNIGQCHRKLGQTDEAITFYKSYLREAPDARNRREVEHRIEELESLRDAQNASIASSGAPRPAPASEAAQANAVAATAATATATGVDLDARAGEPASSSPIYSRWWFWASTGAVVVASTAVAIVMARRDPTAVPPSSLGAQRAMP